MYRLLIVDDEELIVDSLQEMFDGWKEAELEIHKAYSAKMALEHLQRTRFDIVLTDIQMPGMTGLELLKVIQKQWPRCKVIFLTGYNDFDYVKTAISHQGFEYILKTEKDDAIVEAVEKAMHKLLTEREMDGLIRRAEEQLRLALPVIRKEFFTDLLEGDARSLRVLADHLKTAGVPFDPSQAVWLVMARIDNWRPDHSCYDQALMRYAVQNIGDELLGELACSVSFTAERNKIVWLLQPGAESAPWDMLGRQIMGVLDEIQTASREWLKLTISLAASSEPSAWSELSVKYARLKQSLAFGMGKGGEVIVGEDDSLSDKDPGMQSRYYIQHQMKQLHSLEDCLAEGRGNEFERILDELDEAIRASPGTADGWKSELYYTLASLFVSLINRWGVPERFHSQWNVQALRSLDYIANWNDTIDYFKRMGRSLVEINDDLITKKEHELIRTLHKYIDEHLDGDLSLPKLGEIARLNPSYLSRLYKQLTGRGLSEHISNERLQRAKKLLASDKYRIQDIAAALGYSDDHYFYTFFKKMTGKTPHEYREGIRK